MVETVTDKVTAASSTAATGAADDAASIHTASEGRTKEERTDPLPRLTDAQQFVLVRASQHADGELIGPRTHAADGGAFDSTLNERRTIEAMVRRGLVKMNLREESAGEESAVGGDTVNPTALDPASFRLTPLAFEALGIGRAEWPERMQGSGAASSRNSDGGSQPVKAVPPTLRSGSKGHAVLELLQRPDGAALDELCDATGWQAHSVRSFLSGTVRRRLGFTVMSERDADGVRLYRVDRDGTNDDGAVR